jgi:hypothetical protein
LPGKPNIITGCNLFALLRTRKTCASAKSCYASPTTLSQHIIFAFTRSFFADVCIKLKSCKEKSLNPKNHRSDKGAQRPVRARGREPGLWGGSDWPDLIFWLLLYQDKSNSHPAAIERGQATRVKASSDR